MTSPQRLQILRLLSLSSSPDVPTCGPSPSFVVACVVVAVGHAVVVGVAVRVLVVVVAMMMMMMVVEVVVVVVAVVVVGVYVHVVVVGAGAAEVVMVVVMVMVALLLRVWRFGGVRLWGVGRCFAPSTVWLFMSVNCCIRSSYRMSVIYAVLLSDMREA